MADDSLNSEKWPCTEDYKEYEADPVEDFGWEESGALDSQNPLYKRWDEERKKEMEPVAVDAEKSKGCDADLSDVGRVSPDYSSMVVQDSLSPELPSDELVSDEVTSVVDPFMRVPNSLYLDLGERNELGFVLYTPKSKIIIPDKYPLPEFSDKVYCLDEKRKGHVEMLGILFPEILPLIYSDPQPTDSLRRSPK